MKHDLLHIQGKPYVLIPLHEYRMITDESARSEDTALPSSVLDELSAAQDTPIRILRKFRGLTQDALAAAAGLSRPYLAEIEKGRKTGSVQAIRAIAGALSVDVRYIVA